MGGGSERKRNPVLEAAAGLDGAAGQKGVGRATAAAAEGHKRHKNKCSVKL